MDSGDITLAVGCVLPFLSVAFFGMGIARYFCDDATIEQRRVTLWSFLTYGLYWLTALVSYIDRPKGDVITGDIFRVVTLPLGVLLLVASVCFELRSHVAVGRRVAMASVSMIAVYVVYGDIFYLGMLLGTYRLKRA